MDSLDLSSHQRSLFCLSVLFVSSKKSYDTGGENTNTEALHAVSDIQILNPKEMEERGRCVRAHDGYIPVNKLPCVRVPVVPVFLWLGRIRDGQLIMTEVLKSYISRPPNHPTSMMSVFNLVSPYSLQPTVSNSQHKPHIWFPQYLPVPNLYWNTLELMPMEPNSCLGTSPSQQLAGCGE